MILSDLFESPLISREQSLAYKQNLKSGPTSLPYSNYNDDERFNSAIPYIKKFCSDAIEQAKLGKMIFKGLRGFEIGHDSYFIDTTKTKRESANTNNFFTALTGILPSWKNWPKRDECLVFTSSNMTANGYGKIFVVLPFNNTPVAIASTSDIWTSFSKLREIRRSTHIDDFNYLIIEIHRIACLYFDIDLNHQYDYNRHNIMDYLEKIDLIIGKCKEIGPDRLISQLYEKGLIRYQGELIKAIIKNIVDSRDTLTYCDRLFDPTENNNILTLIKDYSPPDTDREVWFSGRAFIVDYKYISDVIKDGA